MTDETRYAGSIARVSPRGDFGFCDTPDGRSVFLHRADLPGGARLEVGAQIEFRLVETGRGLRAAEPELIA